MHVENPYSIDHEHPDLRLSTLGSRGLGLSVRPAAAPDAELVLWLDLHDGPLAIGLTREESNVLVVLLGGSVPDAC